MIFLKALKLLVLTNGLYFTKSKVLFIREKQVMVCPRVGSQVAFQSLGS